MPQAIKRILLLTSEFPPQPGGIGNHAWHLARSFAAAGKQVVVISDQRSVEGEEERLFDAEQDFKIIRIKRRKPMALAYLNRFRQAKQAIRHADALLLSGKFSLWLGAGLSFNFKGKKIGVLHGSELQLPKAWQRQLTRYGLKRLDERIAVSHYTRSLVKGIGNRQVHVIPNGFALPEIKSKSSRLIPAMPLRLITVGNLTQRKGQHNIIKALPLLKKHFAGVSYHMLGLPTEKKALQALGERLGVADRLHFHGRVSESDKIKQLQAAHIFMMLSENTAEGDVEGFGIAILEANALGLPGIGSRGCGIEDAIAHGKSGLLVDAQAPEQVLEQVQQIMKNYASFSSGAQTWAKNFSWEKIIPQYLKILEA
ncbi:glycosyltransferase family 4 protein [Mesonia sp. HuA40]|uniref:glycosyltransferase family 4 protein n=1 Tax=Mesonia sp. HuA40 TaxID=2602761 RepID=UPI002104662C|nr:glycosyltransferase family 4 protein [Mesonia sp. HuA40]